MIVIIIKTSFSMMNKNTKNFEMTMLIQAFLIIYATSKGLIINVVKMYIYIIVWICYCLDVYIKYNRQAIAIFTTMHYYPYCFALILIVVAWWVVKLNFNI